MKEEKQHRNGKRTAFIRCFFSPVAAQSVSRYIALHSPIETQTRVSVNHTELSQIRLSGFVHVVATTTVCSEGENQMSLTYTGVVFLWELMIEPITAQGANTWSLFKLKESSGLQNIENINNTETP